MDVTVFDVRNIAVVEKLLNKCDEAGVQTMQILPEEEDLSRVKVTPSRKRMPTCLSFAETDKFNDAEVVTSSTSAKHKKKHRVVEDLQFPEDLCGKKVNRDVVASTKQILVPYTHSNDLLLPAKCGELYMRFLRDGYIYIQSLLTASDVAAVRSASIATLKSCGYLDKQQKPKKSAGVTVDLSFGGFSEGKNETLSADAKGDAQRWRAYGKSKEVQAIIQHLTINRVLQYLSWGKTTVDHLNNQVYSFNQEYAWLRVKSVGECVMEHCDYYYYKNNTSLLIAADMTPPASQDSHSSSSGSNSSNTKPKSTKGKNIVVVVDDVCCEVCKESLHEKEIILCDECNLGYHTYCLRPRLACVPSSGDAWYGPCCTPRTILGTCWVPLGVTSTGTATASTGCYTHNAGGSVSMLAESGTELVNFDRALKNADIPMSYFTKGKTLTWHSPTQYTGAGGDNDDTCEHIGDVVFFDSKTVHCTSKNLSALEYVLSMDFRWAIAPVGRHNWGLTPQSEYLLEAATLNPTIEGAPPGVSLSISGGSGSGKKGKANPGSGNNGSSSNGSSHTSTSSSSKEGPAPVTKASSTSSSSSTSTAPSAAVQKHLKPVQQQTPSQPQDVWADVSAVIAPPPVAAVSALLSKHTPTPNPTPTGAEAPAPPGQEEDFLLNWLGTGTGTSSGEMEAGVDVSGGLGKLQSSYIDI